MTGSGSPCGACKFLRRKCVKGCVFAPYFCHEQGTSQFGAIHKVFGASNVSKLLSHLPVSYRSEAALTIAYQAQARLHDPIYGCVSQIFALQHQVMNLQAQIASLEEQAAAQGFLSGSNTNPAGYASLIHQLNPNLISRVEVLSSFHGKGYSTKVPNCVGYLDNTFFHGDNCSPSSVYEDGSRSMDEQWGLKEHNMDDLEALSFRYNIGH